MESSIAAFSCAAIAISWEEVVDTAIRDEDYQRLVKAVESSFPHWARNDEATAQYHGERHSLYNKDGVIMSNHVHAHSGSGCFNSCMAPTTA